MAVDPDALKPVPAIAMLVPYDTLSDPWLRWLHARVSARTRVTVWTVAPRPARSPVRSGARAWLAWLAWLAWPAWLTWLQGLESRLARIGPWPVHPPVVAGGDPGAVLAADPIMHRIVLDLTDGSVMPEPLARDERWCLLVGHRRLTASSRYSGYPEVERGAAVSELSLVACTAATDPEANPGNPGTVLARMVQDTRWCGALNRRVLLGNVPLAIDKAIEHWRRGERAPISDRFMRVEAPDPVVPGHRALLNPLGRLLRQQGRQRWFNARRRAGQRPGMWSLYVGEGPAPIAGVGQVVEVRPDGNDYWADPFLWQRDGRCYLYYEAYDYRTMRGRIAVGELTPDRRLLPIGDVLSPPHHLSYPFLIEHRGELLMIPESSALRRVEIWRCTRFPDRFERIATCFDGQAVVDLTLFRRAGQWWAFCAMAAVDGGDTNGQLYAFAVDGPLMRTIVPHARNPIVTDSRVARPAGRVFEQDGRWYRPSQDNSHGTYGHALNLMQIHVLTPDDYHESRVHRTGAELAPGLTGVHHLDVAGELFVVDGCHASGGRPSRRARKA